MMHARLLKDYTGYVCAMVGFSSIIANFRETELN